MFTLQARLPLILLCFAAVPCTPSLATAGTPEFAVDVMAVLSKAGCNAGACHGNLNGKGGFKLSLRGQDANGDHTALTRDARGRRLNCFHPAQSLLLQKATARIAHQGGKRFAVDSPEYTILSEWIAAGAPAPHPQAPTVTQLEVLPETAVLEFPTQQLQLSVTATFSDGTQRDVTHLACYEASNLLATVNATGQVTCDRFGETTIIVRYLQQQTAVSVAAITERRDFVWNDVSPHNAIDTQVLAKLRRLRMQPSAVCSDRVFIRRAYLDAIGRLPTADEARRFIANPRIDKRAQLLDRLLARPEFADLWALKWADILRTEEKVLDHRGVEVFHGWIHNAMATAQPMDAFVRELVTGTGSTYQVPAANYYRANRDPHTRGETTARLFLGTRLQCAKCHNHPFDQWTQDDYYQWSAVFSQLDYTIPDNKRRDKFDKNEFVGEQIVIVKARDEVRNPTTGQVAHPRFLGAGALTNTTPDQRLSALATWLTSDQNQRFAASQVNFIWYHIMGQGLVDPIDDFRITNPASNPPLLNELRQEFQTRRYDLRALIRYIMSSRTYQLSAAINASNRNDTTSYSHANVRRLSAEVLLDAQSDVLDVPAQFVGYQRGMRAIQIPGVRKKRIRDASPEFGDRFLMTFGKPERILACECERSAETTLKQTFTLLGAGLHERLAEPHSRIARLAATEQSDTEVINELFWVALTRPPGDDELQAACRTLEAATSRAEGLQDVVWALLNAKEFIFRR